MSPVKKNDNTKSLTDKPSAVASSFKEKIVAFAEVLAVAFLGLPIALFLNIVLVATYVSTSGQTTPTQQGTRGLFSLLFADALVTVSMIWILQRARAETFSQIGLLLEDYKNEIRVAGFALAGLFGLTVASSLIFHYFLPSWVTRENELLALLQTPFDLFLFLATSICVGGFKEELQRGFILDRFDKKFGAAHLGLLLWSFIFGAMHLYQGADSAVTAGLLGLMLGSLYLSRRSLLAPMIAHAAFNIIMVLTVWFYPSFITY
jgi:membrane protease YdiL (CAAX protease family)